MTEPLAANTGATPERRYYGTYRGTVADNDDPLRLGRVKCRVPEVLGLTMMTDWAAFKGGQYGGSQDSGVFAPPDLLSAVYVEFESGDVNRPLYTGTWWGQRTGLPPETPALARADGDLCWKTDPSTLPPKGTDGFKDATGLMDQCQPWSMLRTAGGPTYPHNKVFRTKNNGITFEVDDSPGRGRIAVWHGPSQSWFEMGPTGEVSIRIAGKSYRLVEMDDRHHVRMSRHAMVDLDDTLRVGKDRWLRIVAQEKRETIGPRETQVTGEEKRVNLGGLKTWTMGERIDVVTGNWTQWVVGNLTTNVFGNYDRLAAGVISDKASAVSHGAGAPTGSPPDPPDPFDPLEPPNCPTPPTDTSCPPTPPAP